MAAARTGHLPTVSFVKPYGAENEHPGYASESNGSDHLVDLLKTIRRGPEAKSTLVVVTYDEFGGQWDHVSPPKVDAWGPGTRIPALVLGGRQQEVGRGPHGLRHDLDPGHHRAQLPPEAAVQPRCPGARPRPGGEGWSVACGHVFTLAAPGRQDRRRRLPRLRHRAPGAPGDLRAADARGGADAPRGDLRERSRRADLRGRACCTRAPGGWRGSRAPRCWSVCSPATSRWRSTRCKTRNQTFKAVSLARLPLQLPMIRAALKVARAS